MFERVALLSPHVSTPAPLPLGSTRTGLCALRLRTGTRTAVGRGANRTAARHLRRPLRPRHATTRHHPQRRRLLAELRRYRCECVRVPGNRHAHRRSVAGVAAGMESGGLAYRASRAQRQRRCAERAGGRPLQPDLLLPWRRSAFRQLPAPALACAQPLTASSLRHCARQQRLAASDAHQRAQQQYNDHRRRECQHAQGQHLAQR